MTELRACDCGAVARVWTRNDKTYIAWVECGYCERRGPMFYGVNESGDKIIAAAIAGWNHRPEEDELRARIAELLQRPNALGQRAQQVTPWQYGAIYGDSKTTPLDKEG